MVFSQHIVVNNLQLDVTTFACMLNIKREIFTHLTK